MSPLLRLARIAELSRQAATMVIGIVLVRCTLTRQTGKVWPRRQSRPGVVIATITSVTATATGLRAVPAATSLSRDATRAGHIAANTSIPTAPTSGGISPTAACPTESAAVSALSSLAPAIHALTATTPVPTSPIRVCAPVTPLTTAPGSRCLLLPAIATTAAVDPVPSIASHPRVWIVGVVGGPAVFAVRVRCVSVCAELVVVRIRGVDEIIRHCGNGPECKQHEDHSYNAFHGWSPVI